MFCNPNIHGNLTNYAGRALPVLGTTNRLASASYDASGNLTSWAGFSYTWDVANQMTGMQGNGLSRRFAYTAAGERMLEWDQNLSRYTLSLRGLAGEVLREVTYSYGASSNSWQVFWEKDTMWARGRLLANVSRNQGIQHYHVDRLGSPRMVTNRCGQRVKTFDHNPWGMDRFAGMQDGERHRFTAHQRDVGNLTRSWDDVDYMHARYYTGYLARFLSPDPVRGEVFSPESLNLFAYVGGNPTNLVDPWGLAALDPLAQQGNSYMFSEQVTVTAAHPCPGAPKELSCEAWQSVKEMQWRMILGWNRPLSQTPALFPTPTSPNMRAARPEEVARSAESLSSTERAPELVFGGGLKVTFAFPILGKKVPLLLVGEASWQPWTVVKLEASVQSGLGTPSVAGGLFFFLQNAGFGNEPSSGFSIFGGRGWGGGLSVLLENKYLGRAEVLFGGGVGLAGTVPVYVYPLGAREWGH